MFLYRSNQSERLVEELSRVVRRPLADPLTPELVVVHSKGMERWLSMQLSQRLGIWANAEFPFPRHLLRRIFDSVLGQTDGAAERFEPELLMWSIAALLPAQLNDPAFASIAHYLEQDHAGGLLLQLAQRIARVYDDYSVFRPELLLGWERGEEQSWDARLWRAICERHGRAHQAARALTLIERLECGAVDPRTLPERICMFGMASLPALYLSVLSALGAHVEIHLFVLSPTREYFGDLRRTRLPGNKQIETGRLDGVRSRARPQENPQEYSEYFEDFSEDVSRERARPGGRSRSVYFSADAKAAASGTIPEASAGHPLLASLGRLGREFQELLEERTQYVEHATDLYFDPGTDTVLHTLQSDMLGLRNRGAPAGPAHAAIAADDDSLAIHVCHSRMRELEVLHDQLSALLEAGDLEPHEIVVMTPDIEPYAPVIEAVFGARSGRPQLPYSVADRKVRKTAPVIDAFYALLAGLSSRMTASSVLDLLGLDCVRARFEIESEQLDQLRSWIERAGIRWGVDPEHRAEVGQPALADNTWRAGLARMLLGYALPAQRTRLYAGVLPLDGIEGTSAQLLGRLAEACERLFEHRVALRGARSIDAWRGVLSRLLHDLIDARGERAHEHQLIGSALERLAEGACVAGFDAAVELDSVQSELMRRLDAALPARGLLSRGITFCQLVPMRGIPFRVVCLIGMNDDVFPGHDPQLSFDRRAQVRALGDRNRRDDDRYVFLEALLCARERVIVTYVGRGIRDNRVLQPSVVIGELLDAVEQSFEPTGPVVAHEQRRHAIEQRFCVLHRLHAFSPRYFRNGGERLFSYASDACAAARALSQPRHDPALLAAPLTGTAPLEELTIEELVGWLTLPVRSFLQSRLGLYLGDELAPLPGREPLVLDGLERWKLGTDLLELALRGFPPDELLDVARGHGALPLGTVGALEYQDLVQDIAPIAAAAAAHLRGGKLEPLRVELDLDGVRITGTLRELWPGAHLHANFSKLGRRFELAHFVRHVVMLCVLAERPDPRYPARSVVLARPAQGGGVAEVHFGALADPRATLIEWLRMVRAAQTRALPFAHDASRAYAELCRDDPNQASRQAARRFEDTGFGPDPYIHLLYPDFAALTQAEAGAGFGRWAELVFGPFFAARTVCQD